MSGGGAWGAVAGTLLACAALTACSDDGHAGPTCAADFPCFEKRSVCIGSGQYRRVQTFPCEHTCGDRPCTGGTCEPVGPVLSCPPGTFCSRTWLLDPCAPPDAGPVDAAPSDLGAGDIPLDFTLWELCRSDWSSRANVCKKGTQTCCPGMGPPMLGQCPPGWSCYHWDINYDGAVGCPQLECAGGCHPACPLP